MSFRPRKFKIRGGWLNIDSLFYLRVNTVYCRRLAADSRGEYGVGAAPYACLGCTGLLRLNSFSNCSRGAGSTPARVGLACTCAPELMATRAVVDPGGEGTDRSGRDG